MATRKGKATRLLEDLAGGPLTLGRYVCSIREGEEMSQVEFARKLGSIRPSRHVLDVAASARR